ncbi:MAG: LppA family lipoprotein [Mycobacteriaceae bacterium]|nr:LppA family lipoprotein [Mycobacteriaceae bacterium]
MERPYEPTPPSEAAQALQQLKALPSLEDTTAQVQAAIDEITAAASVLIPSIEWETLHEGSTGNCERPYEQADGQRYFLPLRVAENVAVSEQNWAAIVEAAKASAAKLDATDVAVMKDQPADRDVWFSGPTGIFIKIGYAGNLGVAGYTGCRLPRDKKGG